MTKYDDIARLVREETNGEYEFIKLDRTNTRGGKPTLRVRHHQCGEVFARSPVLNLAGKQSPWQSFAGCCRRCP